MKKEKEEPFFASSERFFVSFIIRIELSAKNRITWASCLRFLLHGGRKKEKKKVKKQMIGLIILSLIESISSFELKMLLNCLS